MLAGYGERDITPSAGQPLMGNTREDYRSTGTHDPLKCKVLVFRNSRGNSLGIAALDLCMLPGDLVSDMKKRIGELCGKDVPEIMFCATHTHSGPAVVSLYGAPVMDRRERERISELSARAVAAALADIKPASLSYGEAQCGTVGFYRRLQTKDGKTVMNWELPEPDSISGPPGIPDGTLRVLHVKTEKRSCCIVHFPLHPAILDYRNREYSKDFPCFLEEGLKQVFSEDMSALFLNGCCGNINHIDYQDPDMPRRGYPAAQRIGYALALAAAEAVRRAVPVMDDSLVSVVVPVGFRRIKISPDLAGRAAECVKNETMEDSGIDGLPFALQAPLLLDLNKVQNEPLETGICLFRIGNIPFFGLPGEVFTELGSLLLEKIRTGKAFVIELVNDAVGYIPHEEAFSQGGYETMPGAALLAPGEGERMIKICSMEYEKMFGKPGESK